MDFQNGFWMICGSKKDQTNDALGGIFWKFCLYMVKICRYCTMISQWFLLFGCVFTAFLFQSRVWNPLHFRTTTMYLSTLFKGFLGFPVCPFPPPTNRRPFPFPEAHNERLKVEMEERIAAAEQEIGALGVRRGKFRSDDDAIDTVPPQIVEVFR